jgi:dolichyl-phosphate-mannose-protein mannosyltransferase
MCTQAKRLWQWCATQEGRVFLAFLGVALYARLIIAPYQGFFGDLQEYVTWGVSLDQHFFHVYSTVGSNTIPLNYPPLMVYLFGLMAGAYGLLEHLRGGHAAYVVSQAPLLNVLIKLPAILADLATLALLYSLARRRRSKRWALVAAATYAFSPTILFDGALWGQVDGVSTFAALLGLLFALKRRGLWAGIFFGAALMLKPQPVVFVPLALLYLWRWGGRREAIRACIGMLGSAALICLPYLLPPAPEMLIYLKNVNGWVLTSHAGDALNLWWILDPQRSFSSPGWIPVVETIVGWALFSLALVIVIKGIVNDNSPKTLWSGAAILALAFFTLTTLQHERYLYPALALLLIAAFYDKRIWPLYAAATLTAFLNMAIAAILYDSPLYQNVPQLRDFLTLHPQITHALQIAIAWINMALLLGALALYLPRLHQRPAPPAQRADRPASLPLDASEGVSASLPS